MRSFILEPSNIPKKSITTVASQLIGSCVYMKTEKGHIKMSVEGEGTRDSVCNERAISAFALSMTPEVKVSISILNDNDELIGFLGELKKQ